MQDICEFVFDLCIHFVKDVLDKLQSINEVSVIDKKDELTLIFNKIDGFLNNMQLSLQYKINVMSGIKVKVQGESDDPVSEEYLGGLVKDKIDGVISYLKTKSCSGKSISKLGKDASVIHRNEKEVSTVVSSSLKLTDFEDKEGWDVVETPKIISKLTDCNDWCIVDMNGGQGQFVIKDISRIGIEHPFVSDCTLREHMHDTWKQDGNNIVIFYNKNRDNDINPADQGVG